MNSSCNGNPAADACAARANGSRSGSRSQVGGASTLTLVIALLVIAAFAAWWFLGQRGTAPAPVAVSPKASVTTPATPQSTAPPPTAELSVEQLFKAARTAVNENRVTSPPGNNALEDYIHVLDKQPGDATAVDALRELFPFATDTVQEQINTGNYDDANRIIGLLAKADPSNYTLTILRSKLDAKRKQDDQQELAQKSAALAAQRAAATSNIAAAASTAEATAAKAAEEAAAAAPKPAPTVARTTPAPAAAPAPAPPAPVGETRDVRIVTPPQPTYPAAAARNRQDGSVEVEFTIAADGSVQNVRVTNSTAHVFDSSAVSAVQRAKFEPRLVNGQPTASTLRRRIEFKLDR